jgi:hypothetical protein
MDPTTIAGDAGPWTDFQIRHVEYLHLYVACPPFEVALWALRPSWPDCSAGREFGIF